MRRFLLLIGSLAVGFATVGGVLSLSAGPRVMGPVIVEWLVVLVVGVLLSAPFFLAPPGTIGIYSFQLPLVIALVVLVFRGVAWVGRMILTGVWSLVFLVWRPAGTVPTSTGTPSPNAVGAPGTGTPGTTGAPALPPSWQTDPTGRFLQRYWDGARWTAHVANGGLSAIDPL